MVAAQARNFTFYLYYTTTDSFDTLSSSLLSAIAISDATRSPPLTVLLSRIQGGSNMTGTDLYVNKPHCAAAVRL